MELAAILENLGITAALGGAEIRVHAISRNRERAFALFPANRGGGIGSGTVGGTAAAGHEMHSITAVLRWGRDGSLAECKANEIYGILQGRHFRHMGKAAFVLAAKPVWAGMDERGVYEYVVEIDVCFERLEVRG